MARLIDGDALIAWIKGSQQMTSKMKSIICYIKTMPTIDAVSVVRCKDCKKLYDCRNDSWQTSVISMGYVGWCIRTARIGNVDYVKADDFCSYGERKETDHE